MDQVAQYLTLDDYETKPWKNGKGLTHDIFLSPKGAGHDDFHIRFALSPIVEDGPFSSYPGADRVITVIEGEALELDFDDHTARIEPLKSLFFDTGLAPYGRPIGGPVQVINVMARRGVWTIASCEVVSEVDAPGGPDEFLFFFALSNGWEAKVADEKMAMQTHSSLLTPPRNAIRVKNAENGKAIFARLTREG